ncbi:universal stress protein [uncultured Aquimarina sp.]|uniref:universal stress protein n=1 Tax=uncultured Aquimarina sp. TaxID=575652 RepID=UPI00261784E3|nr:universal stress protein [uncultured Aquimarina sp.]
MKKILLLTDFSENSWNAIDYATELFKEESCTFYIVNAYSKIIYEAIHLSDHPSERSVENTVQLDVLTNLKHIKKSLEYANVNKNHYFEIIAVFGTITEVTSEIVASKKIDLIVMGTKGTTAAKEVFIGSNAVRIIKAIKKCPVVVIPSGFSLINHPLHIAFATEFTHFYSKEELTPLIDLAIHKSAKIDIVHIPKQAGSLSEEQKFNSEILQEYFNAIDSYVHTINMGDSIASTLQGFAEKSNVDLLAMLNYRYSFLEKLTREPVIKNIAFYSKIPFMILPEIGMSTSFSKIGKDVSKRYQNLIKDTV